MHDRLQGGQEADAAAAAAIALLKGQTPQTTGEVTDTQTQKKVAAILAGPVAIFKDNVKDVVADGYITAAELCGLRAAVQGRRYQLT